MSTKTEVRASEERLVAEKSRARVAREEEVARGDSRRAKEDEGREKKERTAEAESARRDAASRAKEERNVEFEKEHDALLKESARIHKERAEEAELTHQMHVSEHEKELEHRRTAGHS